MSVIATETIIIPAPEKAKEVWKQGIRSVYQIETRIGWKDEIFTCVDVKHHDVTDGGIIASNNIGNFKNPDDAWKAFRRAIKNQEWGTL